MPLGVSYVSMRIFGALGVSVEVETEVDVVLRLVGCGIGWGGFFSVSRGFLMVERTGVKEFLNSRSESPKVLEDD